MKCYKCQEEMYPIYDTAFRKHADGEKRRVTDWICAPCRVYVTLCVSDYSECVEDE